MFTTSTVMPSCSVRRICATATSSIDASQGFCASRMVVWPAGAGGEPVPHAAIAAAPHQTSASPLPAFVPTKRMLLPRLPARNEPMI